MRIAPRFRHLAFYALLLSLCPALTMAQGRSDHDRDNHGQAGRDHDDHDRDHRGMPPGQAKKYFHDQDRDRFYSHYRSDANRWRGRKRPVFVVGRPIERTYVVRPVPRSVWVNTVAPPPPGYQYGYYGGYVVAYNPTTRIIADVLDIVGAAQSR
jgi:hypothetical protein